MEIRTDHDDQNERTNGDSGRGQLTDPKQKELAGANGTHVMTY